MAALGAPCLHAGVLLRTYVPAVSGRALSRSLYVKARGNVSAAAERLQMKVAREGIDRDIMARQRFVKPTLQRQLNANAAVYNRAKRLKNRLVEEFVADPALCPF